MNNNSKILEIVSWQSVKEHLPDNSVHTDFITALENVCEELKAEQKDYFYLAEFEFGEKLINKGSINIKTPSIKPNYSDIKKINFNDDMNYSSDPLGLVLDGYLEIYVENKCDKKKIRVPLAMINRGELFGTFGTLDLYSGITDKLEERDWFVASGNLASLCVATSLHNSENDYLDGSLREDFLNEEIVIDKWINFINFYKNTNWTVKVVYIPKHIINAIEKKCIQSLFKIGWQQSYPLRNVLLANNTITNTIARITTKLNHDKLFLNDLYNFILKAISGQLNCFIPIVNENHFIQNAIDNFYTSNSINKNTISFLAFQYKQIPEKGFGILPLFQLPVLNEYRIESLTKLFEDLHKIDALVSDTKYKIMRHIEGFNNLRSQTKYIKHHQLLKDNYLSKAFKIESHKISLTSKEFSNIILIKRI